jgi:hypothetical protein
MMEKSPGKPGKSVRVAESAPVIYGTKIKEKARVHVDVPGELHRQIRLYALQHGLTMRDTVIQGWEKLLKQHKAETETAKPKGKS